jgi:thiol-disulfide isomerase/thioredoxin
MKKILVLPLVIFVMLSCSSNKYKINGDIERAPEQTVYLMQIMENDYITVDSTLIKDGKFTFKGSVPYPDIYAIHFDQTQERIVLFLENSDITIIGSMNDFQAIEIVGSESHNILLDFNKLAEEKSQTLMDISFQYQSAAMDGILTSTLEEELTNEYMAEIEIFMGHIKQFVKDNNHSVVSAYITLIHLIDQLELTELQEIAGAFPSNIQESQFVAALNDHLAVEMRTSIGQPYTDFILSDPLGQEIALSTFVGENYVLLDFWAGWCAPCRQENPHLVKLYNTYKSKGFDIYGVSFDRSRDQWLEAIKQDGLLWTQVSDLTGWESPIAKLYGIMSIPANLLISPTGQIIAKNLRGSDLEDKLKEIFGE